MTALFANLVRTTSARRDAQEEDLPDDCLVYGERYTSAADAGDRGRWWRPTATRDVDVSRGSWKKNGALHSVIRVSDQAATSACLRTSLRRW